MNNQRMLASIFFGLIVSGCASVNLERGKALSSAGIAYSKTTAVVIDLAIDAAIDANSQRRVSIVASKTEDSAEKTRRINDLKVHNDELVNQVGEYAKIKRSVGVLEGYFAELQELSGASPASAVETSVKSLADRVNGTSVALGGEAKLSSAQKGAVAGLAKLLVMQAHGAAVGRALERDAADIGRALALQDIALQVAAGDIQALANEDLARFLNRRINDPYGAGGVGAEWVKDRRAYIKAKALGNVVDAIKAASRASSKMHDIWARFLSGESTGSEMSLIIKEINEALDVSLSLKNAF